MINSSVINAEAINAAAGGGGFGMLVEDIALSAVFEGEVLASGLLENFTLMGTFESEWAVTRSLVEGLAISEVFDSEVLFIGLHEALTFSDSYVGDQMMAGIMMESIALSDVFDLTMINGIRESLMISDAYTSQVRVISRIELLMEISAIYQLAFPVSITEAFTLAETLLPSVQKLSALVERIAVSDAYVTQAQVTSLLAEAMTLDDLYTRFSEGAMIEGFTLSGMLIAAGQLTSALEEQIAISDVSTGNAMLGVTSLETVALSDTFSGHGALIGALQENIVFSITTEIDGDVYTAWTVNADTGGLAEYTNYPFNSLAAAPFGFFGAKADGIYELTGDTDAGTDITAVLRTGLMDLDSSIKKRVHEMWIGYTATERVILKVTVTEAGVKKTYWYELLETQNAPTTRRIKFGKGLKARYWQFELVNTDGGAFNIDTIEFHPMLMTRRIGGRGAG